MPAFFLLIMLKDPLLDWVRFPLAMRVFGLLRRPRSEIEQTLIEPGDLRAVLLPYVAVIASLGPLLRFVSHGWLGLFSASTQIGRTGLVVPGGWHRAPGLALFEMIERLAVSIGSWWLLALVLARLAPLFGGVADAESGRKAAACTLTPVWIAAAFTLLGSAPGLEWLPDLLLFGGLVYAIVVGWSAVQILLGTPEKSAPAHILLALGATAVAVLVALYVASFLAPSL